MFLSGGNIIARKLYVRCIKKVPSASLCSKMNPGARRRLLITEDSEQVDVDDLDYEANFESLGHSHKQHKREMETMKEKMQYDIVKRKYFSTKYPNFLTWHDKEQIRLLHKKDRTEWNAMKLSEGFPALPEIIKKVIRSKWRMENAENMKKHDENVRENWKKLKNNEFKELPIDLVTHLKKFPNRQFNYHNYESVVDYSKIEYKPQLRSTEFSDIITSYENLKQKNTKHNAIASKNNMKHNAFDSKKTTPGINVDKMPNLKDKIQLHIEEDTFIISPINSRQSMTLSSLKNKLHSDLEKGKRVSEEELSIIELEGKKLLEEYPKPTAAIDQLDYTKYNTGKLILTNEKKSMDYNHLMYPEKINIPKKILKKGCTYKLNDCFYASDGTFLYRVPGML